MRDVWIAPHRASIYRAEVSYARQMNAGDDVIRKPSDIAASLLFSVIPHSLLWG